MSESEVESDPTNGLKIPRFHGRRGEDYGLWRHRLRAACRVKGVWSVVERSSTSQTTSTTTAGARDVTTLDARTTAKREKASGIIISALGDAPLRVVMDVDDDPSKMLNLLDARYASNRTVSRIAVQTQLFRMSYTGQNMATYVDQFTSLFSQLERMGEDAAIPESHKAPMLLASIDPSCALESTAAALRTKDIDDLKWDYVATTLIDEYNARQTSSSNSGKGNKNRNRKRRNRKSGGPTNNTQRDNSDSDDDSDIESTVRVLAAALKSFKSDRSGTNGNEKSGYHCDFCDKSGHTQDRCFLNPDNPNNKLPPKVRQLFSAQTKKADAGGASGKGSAKSNKMEIAGAMVEKTTISPPCDLRSYADSGATVHCFHSDLAFVPGSLEPCETRTVMLADKRSVNSNQCGDVIIPFQNANIRLKGALLVPNLGYNLVSTGRLADNGIESHFRRRDVQLSLEESRFVVGCGERDEETGMYMLPEPISQSVPATAMVASTSESELWHRRLAHINSRDLVDVHKHADGVPKLCPLKGVCRACRLGKAHKLPFPGHFRRAKAVGDLVHSDIVGPLEPSFPERYRYASPFLDDHSRYTFIGLMRRRSAVQEVFSGVTEKIRRLGGDNLTVRYCGPVAKLHSDGAQEYVALQKSLGGGEDNNSFSPPYTPELNGIAERVNRTMVEGALAMLIQADLPKCLWPFALKHVVYVRNRVLHSSVGATPFSVLTGEQPSLKNVRVFGCTAYVLRLPRGSKFESRAVEGVYLETLEHGVYKVLIHEDDGIPRIVESRHVTFDESKFLGASSLEEYMDDEDDSDEEFETEETHGNDLCSESEYSSQSSISISEDALDNDEDGAFEPSGDVPPPDGSDSEPEDGTDESNYDSAMEDEDPMPDSEPQDETSHGDTTQSPTPDDAQSSRYPRRERRKPPAWFMASSAQCSQDVPVTTGDEPSLREALASTPQERNLWESAIDEEFGSLHSNQAWRRDDSPGAQPLPTHAILKVKRKSGGKVDRFKARFVVGGNFQKYGEDYNETYAPVVSFSLVRVFLYLVLCLRMCIGQLDVKTAFLNGDLEEEVWVMSPRGIPGRPSKCYRLLKAMYGLKQAHLAWHKKLCGDLEGIGFEELPSAPCVFRRKCLQGQYAFILVYVDDLLILAHTPPQRDTIVGELKKLYELRVSDGVDLFLGVELKWKQDANGRLVSLKMAQPMYTESVLRRFGLQNSKPACTPMVESFFKGLADESDKSMVQVERYQQMIGSLLYLALRTRPDIVVAVLILARFQNAPTAYCHRSVKRVMRYLRGTSEYGVHYTSGNTDLHGYVDSDYAGDTVDRKSMSGYLIKLGSATCLWGSKKQTAVALSTCESEYYAMTLAAQEIMWMRRVLNEAGLKMDRDTPLRSDNKAAIEWAIGERCPSSRAKHIDVRVHFIRELVEKSGLKVTYVSTEENDADMLTKPLGPVLLNGILPRIGLGGAIEEEC